MKSFSARTRIRGEITYCQAEWIYDYYGDKKYAVKFSEGPHAGKVYPAKRCKIAKQEHQQWSPILEGNRNA